MWQVLLTWPYLSDIQAVSLVGGVCILELRCTESVSTGDSSLCVCDCGFSEHNVTTCVFELWYVEVTVY